MEKNNVTYVNITSKRLAFGIIFRDNHTKDDFPKLLSISYGFVDFTLGTI